jgi:hypothetical protein
MSEESQKTFMIPTRDLQGLAYDFQYSQSKS